MLDDHLGSNILLFGEDDPALDGSIRNRRGVVIDLFDPRFGEQALDDWPPCELEARKCLGRTGACTEQPQHLFLPWGIAAQGG